MKTVKNENEVRRVSDEQAQKLVASGEWWYCPKSVYKQSRRPTRNAQDLPISSLKPCPICSSDFMPVFVCKHPANL